jgi:hypothetical protein
MSILAAQGIETTKPLRPEVERIANAEFKQFRNRVGVTRNRRRPRA